MELLTLLIKTAIAGVVLSSGIFAALIVRAWMKEPERAIKLSFMGFSVELGVKD